MSYATREDIEKKLKSGWEPSTSFAEGMKPTCEWIRKQYQDRKAGKRTVS